MKWQKESISFLRIRDAIRDSIRKKGSGQAQIVSLLSASIYFAMFFEIKK